MQASRFPMVAVDEAISTVLARTPVLSSEVVSVDNAVGRVLAETVVASDDMPPFAAASVDGYALVASDGTAPRRVATEIVAGVTDLQHVEPGMAVRIMTGAPVPPGADAVVMVEDVTERDGVMYCSTRPRSGDNVHRQGQDVQRGQTVLTAGATLGSAEIGLLATVGHAHAAVYRRPLVAVIATGDELVDASESLRPGAIRDSNSHALIASVVEAGGEPYPLGRVSDDEDAQQELIQRGLSVADVVLTSGGVSVGSRDLIKPILSRLGQIHFGRVSFKPGKPTTFATVGDKLVFGLPGFPVSSLVSFEIFVRPALRRMQGFPRVTRPMVQVVVEHELRRAPDRPEYQRAIVRWDNGRLVARSTGIQRSSRLLSLVGANALLRIDAGDGKIPAGGEVNAVLIGEISPS
jgi:molybdopterin molybdotransferase